MEHGIQIWSSLFLKLTNSYKQQHRSRSLESKLLLELKVLLEHVGFNCLKHLSFDSQPLILFSILFVNLSLLILTNSFV